MTERMLENEAGCIVHSKETIKYQVLTKCRNGNGLKLTKTICRSLLLLSYHKLNVPIAYNCTIQIDRSTINYDSIEMFQFRHNIVISNELGSTTVMSTCTP